MDDASSTPTRPSGVYLALTGALALLIGLTLQFSAAGKLLGPNPHLFVIEAGSEGWPDGLLRDHVIAGAELFIVVLLLLFHRWKYAWPFVCVFFGGLLGYSAYALVTGLDCGCFGDLWAPPKGFTVGLNSAFIVGALIVMLMGRIKKPVIIATALLTLGAVGFGYYQAGVDRPDPKKLVDQRGGSPLDTSGRTPAQPAESDSEANDGGVAPHAPTTNSASSLFDIPELASIMAAPQGQQLGYIFLHEEGCSTCEVFKPMIELERDDYAAQGMPIEIVMIEINELEEQHGIPRLIWTNTPTLVCIDGGQVVFYDRGEDIKLPSELLDAWLAGEDLGGRDPADDFGR